MRPVFDTFDKYVGQTAQFYLRHNPLALRYATASYSQFGEDIALAQIFSEDTGFYVDVGAYHPYAGSNTYLFYERGWSGINVEPNPHGFGLLERYRKRDVNISRVVSPTPGPVDFVLDTTRSRIAGGKNVPADKPIIQVGRIGLAELLDELKVTTPIDFISIDCEGHDLKVIESNDWERFRPQAVVVEDFGTGDDTRIDQAMKEREFALHCRLALSKIYVDRR